MFLRTSTRKSTAVSSNPIEQLREALESGTFAAFRARYSGRLEERA